MPAGLPPLALTMGEPAGIAPDITVNAWLELSKTDVHFLCVGDKELLEERARAIGANVRVEEISDAGEAHSVFAGALPVLPLGERTSRIAGRLDAQNAGAVEQSLRVAADLVLKGEASAVVTNPIHKSSLYKAGFRHRGHTDFFGELARANGFEAEPVMMLIGQELRTVPLTVHVPLRDVAGQITRDLIFAQTRVVAKDLARYFGIERPRIAVAGLNPHAGEDGSMGKEETDVIAPAIEALRAEGLDVTGPHSADAMFQVDVRRGYDAAICMYHDQALIPVKTLAFHEGINTTLGLPFVRTSPDHGTALALAGTGKANPSSLVHAMRLARSMAIHSRRNA